MTTPPIDIEREFGVVSNPSHRHCSLIIANTREQAEKLMPLCSGTTIKAIDELPKLPSIYEGLAHGLAGVVVFIPHTADTLMAAYDQSRALMGEHQLPYKTLFLANEVFLIAGPELACYRGKGARDGTVDYRQLMRQHLGWDA